jgi:polyisoprenoid-binding protein YceI
MRQFFRRKSTYLIGIPLLLVAAFVGGPFVYIHFIEGPAPKKLSFSTATSTSTTGGAPQTAAASVDGAWKLAGQSVVGYRVPEVLFGQSTTAVGRTSAVTGDLTVAASDVPAASFTADLTKVSSDQSNRDRQFQGRIMDTSTFPTATFKLTQPIALGAIPADLAQVKVSATGDLTLRGATRPVTFSLAARRNGDKLEVNGTIPIHFSDYNIPNPTFGPARVGNNGELEFLLVFSRA